MPEANGYVLAIDFGMKHIGVAVGQTVTRTATGLATLTARNGIPDWNDLATLAAEYRPICVAVGLPLNMDGTESDMSERARDFAARLANVLDAPIEMVDERLTSREAKAQAQDDRHSDHERAAALIAETWLSENA